MTAKENILTFVQTDKFDDGGLLQSAFDKAKSSGLAVEMVSGSEILLSDLKKDKAVFVMVMFTGECFESLVAKQKRIFGPLCILRCLEKSIPLPNVHHPVYSLAMNGVIMSCTSIDKLLRDKLYQLVKRMGGISIKDFTSSVTHLVAGEVGSKKYTIACNLKTLVVLPSWVEEAWNATQRQDFDATDSDFVASHLCPVFKGCSFCVTGIEGRKRKEIKSTVENHGGTYSAELKLKLTTHLLVERPVGDKYGFALRWNVNCVRPDWLYDCIEAGHWLDEASYLVKSERDLDKTRSSGGRLSISMVNATMNSTVAGASKKAAEAARQSAERHGCKDALHELKQSTDAGVKRTVIEHENEDNFNVTIPSGSMFLDGCKIYLTGFTGEKLECLQKIINAGGATRFNQINASVSHVVMGAKVSKDIKILSKAEFIPHVVTAKWLLDSCRQETCLPETDYHCMETNDVFEDVSRTAASSKKDHKQVTSGEENVVANDDIFNQYLEFMEDDDITGLEEPNAVLETGQNIVEPIEDAEECLKPEDGDDDGNSIDDEELQGLLHGLIISTKGFSEHEETQMKEVIESNGGSVLNETSTKIADFIILPMNYKCDSKAKAMVTVCWLECSLECEELLEPTSNFLFTPFSLPENVYPLKDSVISISQYTGIERDHLMQLAEMLGAHYQEFFSRVARNNLLANTQLLLQEPTGPKYDAAVHWGVPAVSAHWLFECARTGTKVPEGPYKLDKEQPSEEEEVAREEIEKEKGTKDGKVPVSASKQFCAERSSNDEEIGRVKTKDVVLMPTDNETGKELSKSIPTSTDTQPAIIKPPAYFGRPKRPSFDLSDAIEALQSPVCSSGSSSAHSRLSRGSRSSFLLDDYIQENMQAALKNSSNPLGLHGGGVDIASISTKDKQPEENKELETNKFLHGVVLVVSKKLSKQQTDIHNMASAVGADYRCSVDDSCTHVIHEGRLPREYNQVKSKGVHVVSPHWLYTCLEEQRRVDESLFPSTYNPKLTLPVVKTRKSVQVSKEIKPAEKHKEASVETKEGDSEKLEEITPVGCAKSFTTETSYQEMTGDGKILDTEAKELFSQDSGQSDSLRSKEEIRQIHGIMQAMSTHRRKRLHSNNSGPNSRSSSGNSVGESSRKNSRRQSSRLRSLRSKQNSSEDEGDEQAVETITYDDPKSRIERERIIAQLSNCSPNPPTNSECSEDDDDTIDEKQGRKSKGNHSTTEDELRPLSAVKIETPSPSHSPIPTAPPIALEITTAQHQHEPISLLNPTIELEDLKPKKAPKFLLSSMSQQEKIDYGALIEELGGRVFDNQYFSPECCHIIVGQLSRNEKCLASIAAGNWVLHKSFLEASRKAGHFVDEEDHEWGVEIPGESLSNLAIAARRWRMEKTSQQNNSNTKFGAFQNWKVLLCIESSRLASFTRLLEAGDAKVLGTTAQFNETNSATHAFISLSKSSPVESVDFERLDQAGVLVLRTDYIADYLIETPPPSTHKYLFRKPQERLKSRKRKPEEDLSEKNGEKRSRKS